MNLHESVTAHLPPPQPETNVRAIRPITFSDQADEFSESPEDFPSIQSQRWLVQMLLTLGAATVLLWACNRYMRASSSNAPAVNPPARKQQGEGLQFPEKQAKQIIDAREFFAVFAPH